MGEPFIKRARATYYLAWVPMTALVALVLGVGGMGLVASVLVTIPLCAIYAVICDSAYYLARTWPIKRFQFVRNLTNLTVITLFAGGIFTGLGYIASLLLPDPLNTNLVGQLEILFGIGTAYFALSLFFHYLVVAIINTNKAERSATDAAMQTREAELKALRAQLNPHFLFNALNSIAALTVSQPSEARRMCQLLSDFLRETMAVSDLKTLTLGDELNLVKKYLEIEHVRFGDRLNLDLKVGDSCKDVKVPALVLQPLVENAVKHGVAEMQEGGVVKLTANRMGDFVEIVVKNNRDPDEARDDKQGGRGLRIVADRLITFYGGAAKMVVKKENECFTVTLKLPVNAP